MSCNINTKKCENCGKTFKVIIEIFSSNIDDKRESYYCCPYCDKVVDTIRLQGNEEVFCKKI